jgi:hypothetical protein
MEARSAITSRGWVLLSNFANANSLVGRFTESQRHIEGQEKDMAQALEARGLHVCGTMGFQRVTVLDVHRSFCQPAH